MSTSLEASPQTQARIAGVLWMTCIVTGILSFISESAVIVRGDAAATATNILANESAFRFGFVADVLSVASYVGVTGLLYHLLKPAGRSVSLVAALFGLAGVGIGGVACVAHLTPLVLLDGGRYLMAFTMPQLQAMTLAALALQMQVFSISLLFFGFQCLLAGWLIARSRFLPRPLGVLLAIGGSSYVVFSLMNFVAPPLGARMERFIMPIALIGEGALMAWLLVKEIDVERRNERVRAFENAPRFDDTEGSHSVC